MVRVTDARVDDLFMQAPGPGIPEDCQVVCETDFNCDQNIGFVDLNAVLAAWGPCPGCPEDLDGNGSVGFTDLNTLLAGWGDCV